LYQRTEGNPLFLVGVAEELAAQRTFDEQVSPESDLPLHIPAMLRQLIERNVTRLNRDEQRVLAAASTVGETFTAATVAAALGADIPTGEELCTKLVQRH